MANLTPYEQYRSMSWTTDADECEEGCGKIMNEENYVEGQYGHYCSTECRRHSESGGGTSHAQDAAAERRQMGIC